MENDIIEKKLDCIEKKLNILTVNSEINRTNIENKEKNDKSIAVISWILISVILSLVTYVEQLQISANKAGLEANYQYFSKDSNDQEAEINNLSNRISVLERHILSK